MKHVRRLLICLLMVLGLCCAATAETAACDHLWETYNMDRHGLAESEIKLWHADPEKHTYAYSDVKQVCALCGARESSGFGGASPVPHSYTVRQWERYGAGDEVVVTYVCGVCEYVRTDRLALTTILSGEAETCLHGGPCLRSGVFNTSELYENGMLLWEPSIRNLPHGLDPGELQVYEALIYNPQDKTFLWGLRRYCATCGRPVNVAYPVYQPGTEFKARYNGMPIMTEDYFLTDGVPENLPYQLIDRLRQEAAIAE